MQAQRAAVVAAISGVLVMASGTVGFGLGRETAPAARPEVAQKGGGSDAAASISSTGSSRGSAGGGTAPAGTVAADRVLAMPYPGPDFPGFPPYPGQAASGDGLHAVGVAYEQTDDPDAKPGQDLVRQAFAEAAKQAQELAAASNVTLGRLVAVSDVKQTQPSYKGCVEPLAGGAPEGRAVEPDTGTNPPEPAPECNPGYYVISWVFVRYEIA
jgi:hypothetical protein